jgi:hypothetical protein
MTVEPGSNIVKLSAGDWFKIGGVALGLAASLIGVYLHHDRLLTQLVTQQQYTNNRLDRIETKLDESPRR